MVIAPRQLLREGRFWCVIQHTADFAALDNVKNRIMVDSLNSPKYTGVFQAYRSVWRETYDPSKSIPWNSIARVKNFYRVSLTSLPRQGRP